MMFRILDGLSQVVGVAVGQYAQNMAANDTIQVQEALRFKWYQQDMEFLRHQKLLHGLFACVLAILISAGVAVYRFNSDWNFLVCAGGLASLLVFEIYQFYDSEQKQAKTILDFFAGR